MLPLSLLNAAQGQPMMVELKSGETLNGHLVNCDTWMNLTLREVVQTSSDGESFLKMPEAYVRGNIIKYLRVPDQLLDMIKEDQQQRSQERGNQRPRGGMRGGRDNRDNRDHRDNRGGHGGNRGYRQGNNNNNNNSQYRRP